MSYIHTYTLHTCTLYVEIFAGILFHEIVKKLALQNFSLIFVNTWRASFSNLHRPHFRIFYFANED